MAISSLRSVLTGSFLNRLGGITSSSSESAQSSALLGGASTTNLTSSLRSGARAFASAVESLNFVSSVLNLSKSSLTSLGEVTDDLITVTEQATRSGIGLQSRQRLEREFEKLADDFKEIVSGSEIGETEYLDLDSLRELFITVGLDDTSSQSIARVFERFELSDGDDLLASEEIKGSRPVRIPVGANTSRFTEEYDSIFDSERTLLDRTDSYRVLEDLGALKFQIDENIEAVDFAQETLQKNIDLLRVTGLALLEVSDQITSETGADQVARDIRKLVTRDSGSALSQAENLEPLIVASLSLDLGDLSS